MNSLPLISVYIPTFNREDLLIRAVHSVLNQTYKKLEVLVVNDGDELSDSILDEFRNDIRVKIFSTEGSQGACVARNIAISQAKGEFITGLDDDDYFLENRLSTLYEKSKTNSHALCFSPILKEKAGRFKLFDPKMEFVFLKDLCVGNCVGNQVFAPSEYFRNVGMFDESLPAWQDYDLWIRLVFSYGYFIREEMPTYVMNDDVVERISNNFDKVKLARDKFEKKYVFLRTAKYISFLDYNYYNYPGVKIPILFYFNAFFSGIGIYRIVKLLVKKVFF